MEYRHPNIDEIIKVLKHLDANRMLNGKSIKEVLKTYEDWRKQCIEQINKKNENKLIHQFKNSLEDVKAGKIKKIEQEK